MIDNIYQWIVFSFAVWRLSNLLVNEEGPFSMFLRLRLMIGIHYIHSGSGDKLSRVEVLEEMQANDLVFCQTYFSNEFAKLFSCVWCLSVWVGLLFALLEELLKGTPAYDIFNFFLIVLSLSSLAIIIDSVLNRGGTE